MENRKHFCTCKDFKCKLNPHNHDLGCDPCIKKNLKDGEIPACFFRQVDDDLSGLDSFTAADFVAFFLEKKKAQANGQSALR